MGRQRTKYALSAGAVMLIGTQAGLAGMMFNGPPVNGPVIEEVQTPATYQLSIDGVCPGTITLFWGGAPSSTTQVILIGNSLGSFTIPPGPCVGTVMGIMGSVSIVTPPGFFSTGPSGTGSVSGTAGAAACGRYLQMIEGSVCMITNPVQIP